MSLGNEFSTSVIKSVIGKYSTYITQLVTLMIYARWFSPSQFGIAASVTVFIAFFQLLSEIGIGTALINKKKLLKEDRNGLFTLTFIIGVIVAVLFYFFCFFLNYFYSRDVYTEMSIYVCITIFFSSISTLPMSFMQREKKFIHIAISICISEVISMAVVYSLIEYPIDAILSKYSSVSIINFFILYFYCSKCEFGRPTFGWKPSSILPILRFSTFQFGFNFINYFSRNIDNILIGKYIGMEQLGIYEKSYALMRYPLQLLTFAFSPAIQPVFNKYKDNIYHIEEFYRSLLHILLIMGVLCGVSVYFLSDYIVYVILGEQWHDVSLLLKIFSFIIPVQVIMSTSGGVYQALERTDLLFKCGMFSAITNISAIIFGIYNNSMYLVALGLVFSFYINLIQCYYLMYIKLFEISFYNLFVLDYKKIKRIIKRDVYI